MLSTAFSITLLINESKILKFSFYLVHKQLHLNKIFKKQEIITAIFIICHNNYLTLSEQFIVILYTFVSILIFFYFYTYAIFRRCDCDILPFPLV